MNLVENRKFFAFFVTAILMAALRQMGLTPDELQSMYGVSLGDAQTVALDLIQSALIPSFLGWVWPNDPDAGILDYWKVALVGLVLIGILALVVALL